ncbi:MAG: hypothetical protein QM820_15700 [Minicystis sp.]
MSAEGPPELRIDEAQTSVQHKAIAGKMGWTAVALFALAMMLIAAFRPSSFGGAIRPLVSWMFLSSPLLAFAAFIVRIYYRWRPGAVRVLDGDLVLERGDRVTRVPLAELAEGSLHPEARRVEIRRRNGDILRIQVPRVEDGQRLLAATGLDASRRTWSLLLGETTFLDIMSVFFGPAIALPLARAVANATAIRGIGFVTLFLFFSIAIFALVREVLGPAQIVIGADGILVRQRFQRRFYAHDRVAGLAARTERTTLVLTDGSQVRLRTRHLSPAQRAELETRFDDARRAFQAGDAEHAALSQLDRGGRSIAAWRGAIGGLLAQADVYRGRALTRDDLIGVVESPAAPIERRVAAALALSGTNDDDARARMRIAAEASADVRIRIALQKAAEGSLDDEAMEEAVAEEMQRREDVA